MMREALALDECLNGEVVENPDEEFIGEGREVVEGVSCAGSFGGWKRRMLARAGAPAFRRHYFQIVGLEECEVLIEAILRSVSYLIAARTCLLRCTWVLVPRLNIPDDERKT